MSIPTFKRGLKKIYLPNIIFKLCRPSPHIPPNQAVFKVPINLNKLDIRDYLTHIYGLQVVNVRTLIQQGELNRRGRNRSLHYSKGSTYKKAFVTMTSDFHYPALAPRAAKDEDDPYNREMLEIGRSDQKTKLKGWRIREPTNIKKIWNKRAAQQEEANRPAEISS